MAVFKDPGLLLQSNHAAFDAVVLPGKPSAWAGIYRCTVCQREVLVQLGEALPDESQHPHAPGQPAPRWQLVVAAN